MVESTSIAIPAKRIWQISHEFRREPAEIFPNLEPQNQSISDF